MKKIMFDEVVPEVIDILDWYDDIVFGVVQSSYWPEPAFLAMLAWDMNSSIKISCLFSVKAEGSGILDKREVAEKSSDITEILVERTLSEPGLLRVKLIKYHHYNEEVISEVDCDSQLFVERWKMPSVETSLDLEAFQFWNSLF